MTSEEKAFLDEKLAKLKTLVEHQLSKSAITMAIAMVNNIIVHLGDDVSHSAKFYIAEVLETFNQRIEDELEVSR